MLYLSGPHNSGVGAGGAGTATANTDSNQALYGEVMAIYVKYNDSPPAGTTDVVIKTVGTSPNAPTYNLLSRANNATDGWFYPRVQVHDTAGAAIAGEYSPLMISDKINVAIAQANVGDHVDVWLLLRK